MKIAIISLKFQTIAFDITFIFCDFAFSLLFSSAILLLSFFETYQQKPMPFPHSPIRTPLVYLSYFR